ncbi:hypothetical protein DIT68_14790 [Brumimicrobium oceani]|uniref:Uncharacterized protein n=1 Tax=Brumimicrobium oceani TaxID=2100725 RepID=A0A2U2X1E7_9FLAO|nr:hypothetical protein DIT68_14790 [Brumimicrobium oceani]
MIKAFPQDTTLREHFIKGLKQNQKAEIILKVYLDLGAQKNKIQKGNGEGLIFLNVYRLLYPKTIYPPLF